MSKTVRSSRLRSAFHLIALLALLANSTLVAAHDSQQDPQHDLESALSKLVQEFDVAQFDLRDREAKALALEAVLRHAVALAKTYPHRAEPLCWQGWALLAHSRVVQDFGAIEQNQEALRRFEAALAIDANVYAGAPQATLGELYVFGSAFPFPIVFGGKERGRAYFRQAIQLNPQGLQTNLPYANFLLNEKDFEGALQHATAAALAPSLPDRPQADRALRKEAEKLIVWAFTPNR